MKPHYHLFEILKVTKKGYDNYSWLFFIGGVSAIIGAFFKLAGVASFILTLIFFYYAQKLHEKAEERLSKKKE